MVFSCPSQKDWTRGGHPQSRLTSSEPRHDRRAQEVPHGSEMTSLAGMIETHLVWGCQARQTLWQHVRPVSDIAGEDPALLFSTPPGMSPCESMPQHAFKRPMETANRLGWKALPISSTRKGKVFTSRFVACVSASEVMAKVP